MADEEQLRILKSGVEEWNRWREKNPRIWINLGGTNLKKADLSHAQLASADLTGTDLVSADLTDAKLTGANLTRARLSHADLTGTDLTGTNLTDTRMGKSNLSSELLASALGLESVVHWAPSAIRPDALKAAEGRLPDVFLKGIGFQDWEILNTKLHDPNLRADEVIDITYKVADLRTESPIQTNSIFFSYSSKDSEFVESIEGRFDEDGIRSWRDVHDIGAGPIEPQLERAINLNGIVLLVLSKHSVNSDWVEWEVKKARKLQKEKQQESGKRVNVLCPVALDDSWETCHWPGWLKEQIMEYHVLDCSDWREESFQKKYEEKLRAPLGIYYMNQKGAE